MAITSRAIIAPRGQSISSGAIAGAVVGSLLGGSILLVVLGFLYFRYRAKRRKAQAEEALPDSPTYDPENAGSLPGLRDSSSQTGALHQRQVPCSGDGTPDGVASTRRSPTSPRGVDWMESSHDYPDPALDFDTLPQGIDFSLPPLQQTSPVEVKRPVPASLDPASTVAPQAANSSYYDTRISMGSDPGDTVAPTSIQMNELYKAQLREAEEHRRSSSLHKRIWNTITRQSTRNSKGTVSDGAQSPSLQQQYADSPFAAYPPIKQEDGQNTPEAATWGGISSQYVEEPEEIADGAPTPTAHGLGSRQGTEDQPQTQYGQYARQTQDSQYGGFPSRFDSSIRETTEKDPALPSSVLTTGSTYGLPLATQPQDTTEHRERLKSPEIPEPMELDGHQSESNGHSPFRSSHSPQLSPESFTINPMAILHPSNPTEQAAYTTYQIKHSASPPAMPPTAPQIITQQPTQVDTVDPSPAKEDDFADMYLDLPSDDEVRRSIDSYDYSSTPGRSSMAESTGRTPDTRPTASPSPFPSIPEHGQPQPDLSISPNPSRPSPQSGPLVCPECGRAFDQIHKLNHHKRYHDRTHECPYDDCDRKFGTKTHLDRHINDRHLKLKAYHCTEPSCAWFKGGKSFPRKDNWRRHMMKKHGSTPQDFEKMELSYG